MEVRPGYKQTEAGIVPEDWVVKPLTELAAILHGYGFQSQFFKPIGTYRLTTPGHFYEAGGFRDVGDKQKFYDGPLPEGCLLNEGDLIVAMTEQADGLLGSAAWVPTSGTYLHNQRLGKVKVLSPEVSVRYLYRVFNSVVYRAKVRETAAGTKVKHTSPSKLLEIPVTLPPSTAEQEAIAEALGEADALTEALEQLLAKKRHLKEGAMQELLTGNRRLPGFGGVWELVALGDCFELINTRNTELNDNVVTISAQLGFLRQEEFFDKRVASKVLENYYLISRGDFAYNRSYSKGYPYGAIKRLSRYDKGVVTTLYICFRLKTDAGCDPAFYEQYFEAGLLNEGLATVTNEGGRAHGLLNIAKNDFFSRKLKRPPLPEQTAIAAVLSDMDAEIAALEAKLGKARRLKQGMMQELLTGRIRLVPPASDMIRISVRNPAPSAASQPRNRHFDEAVVRAVLTRHFGSEEFPFGAFRRAKLSYLLHRHARGVAAGYRKHVAGPYNPEAKYGGAEKIALRNGYVREHHSGKFVGFVAGENIAQAESYFEKRYGLDVLQWLERFRFRNKDELELLTTVDMAMEDLRSNGRAVSVSAVKEVIASHPKWKPKLERGLFSDVNIARAIAESRALFGG